MRSFGVRLAVFGALLSFLLVRFAAAQAPSDTTRQYPGLHSDERMPVFPGGGATDDVRSSNQRFSTFLTDSLRVPPQSVRDGVSGRVFLSFAVDAHGHTVDLKLKQGLRADVDSAVLRHARRLFRVRWQPGTQAGRPVKVSFTIPLTINKNLLTTGRPFADSLTTTRSFNQGIVLPLNGWNLERCILPADRGLVYGSCIQRLGFSSGGIGQYVRLANLSTGKAVRIEVKPPLRSRAQNAFCYALPPGRYALYKYEFTVSKWYGGEMHEEELHKALINGQPLNTTRYEFAVVPGQLHYLGTWDLSQESQPTFRNEKQLLDGQLGTVFKHPNLGQAVVALPE